MYTRRPSRKRHCRRNVGRDQPAGGALRRGGGGAFGSGVPPGPPGRAHEDRHLKDSCPSVQTGRCAANSASRSRCQCQNGERLNGAANGPSAYVVVLPRKGGRPCQPSHAPPSASSAPRSSSLGQAPRRTRSQPDQVTHAPRATVNSSAGASTTSLATTSGCRSASPAPAKPCRSPPATTSTASSPRPARSTAGATAATASSD